LSLPELCESGKWDWIPPSLWATHSLSLFWEGEGWGEGGAVTAQDTRKQNDWAPRTKTNSRRLHPHPALSRRGREWVMRR
jgi:hypothetical protein